MDICTCSSLLGDPFGPFAEKGRTVPISSESRYHAHRIGGTVRRYYSGIDLQTFFVLEENEQSAIKLAVTNGRVTTAGLTDGRGLTLKAAHNVLRQLTEGGLLEWEGKSGRGPRQYYRIANVD